MPPRKYEIKPYNSYWKYRFNRLKKLLKDTLSHNAISIEHIGSTAVPGMLSKDIVDCLVVLKKFKLSRTEKVIFQKSGYQISYNKIAKQTILLEKGSGSHKRENIHLVPEDHSLIEQTILSRNYLETHPRRRIEYSKLKKQLKKNFPIDYKLYRKGKEFFMKETLDLAKDALEKNEYTSKPNV